MKERWVPLPRVESERTEKSGEVDLISTLNRSHPVPERGGVGEGLDLLDHRCGGRDPHAGEGGLHLARWRASLDADLDPVTGFRRHPHRRFPEARAPRWWPASATAPGMPIEIRLAHLECRARRSLRGEERLQRALRAGAEPDVLEINRGHPCFVVEESPEARDLAGQRDRVVGLEAAGRSQVTGGSVGGVGWVESEQAVARMADPATSPRRGKVCWRMFMPSNSGMIPGWRPLRMTGGTGLRHPGPLPRRGTRRHLCRNPASKGSS